MAFVGLIPPGMLNMTAVRTTIEENKRSGMLFSLGAAIVVLPQAFIALYFANYFILHPEVINRLSMAGVLVLFVLSAFFFVQARKDFKGEVKRRKGNYLFIGMLMSSLNMLAIPFYLLYSTIFEKKGWLILEHPFILIFVFGAFTGAFSLFALYTQFAVFIQKRAQYIARNINYILSILFLILGILTIFNLNK